MRSLVDFTEINIGTIKEELKERGIDINQKDISFGELPVVQIEDVEWLFLYIMSQLDNSKLIFFWEEAKKSKNVKKLRILRKN